MIHRGHFVEYYKNVLIVHPVTRGKYRKWMDTMASEEDGCLMKGREQWKGKNHYEVVDKAHRRVYHVNMEDVRSPCDCHVTRWEKMPCIHVIRVCHWLGEYWRVWQYVGDEYRLQKVQQACRSLNGEEMSLLLWLSKMESTKVDEKERVAMVRSYSHGNGINRRRYHSICEDQCCVKKRKIE